MKVCKGCALGKNSRKKFPNSNSRAEGILDIIHSNVCGNMSTPAIGNFLYYATFIDDYSRKTWIYMLKSKDEVFDKFVEFKASVENLSGRKIKVLRTEVSTPQMNSKTSARLKVLRGSWQLPIPLNRMELQNEKIDP